MSCNGNLLTRHSKFCECKELETWSFAIFTFGCLKVSLLSYCCFRRKVYFGFALYIIDTDYLVYPAYKGRHFHINSWDVLASATETPGNQACQFVETVVLAYQWPTTITLKIFNIIIKYLSTSRRKHGGYKVLQYEKYLPDKHRCLLHRQHKNC